MKKTLVAIAAIAAATGVMAQSSVTVYGIVDVAGYSAATNASKNNEAATKSVKYSGVTNSTLAGSRLGFKGTEDMGNGTKANFVTEMSLNAIGDTFGNKQDGAGAPASNATSESISAATGDKGHGGVFNRQTWAGLSNAKAGEVRIGYQHSLQYDHNGPFSAGFEGAAGARNHLDVLAAAPLSNTVQNAESNRLTGVTYFSPELAKGLTASAQWGAIKNESNVTNAAASLKASHNSLGLNYANGPLAIGAVYGSAKVQTAAASANYGNELKSSGLVAGATYDLGVAKLFAYNGSRTATQAGVKEVKLTTNRVGVQVPVGQYKLFASTGYLTAKEDGTKVSDRKFTQVGALYSLSKRTTVFGLYGQDKDDHALAGASAGTAAAWGPLGAAGTPTDTKTYRVGINHAF